MVIDQSLTSNFIQGHLGTFYFVGLFFQIDTKVGISDTNNRLISIKGKNSSNFFINNFLVVCIK